MKKIIEKGTVTPVLLIVASSFIIVIYALVFILAMQFDFSHRQVASDKALQIAEAGINYYRWHLHEDPDDYQDGTGSAGPYLHEYFDPQGGKIGEYSLEITPPSGNSQIVTIESTGYTSQYPKVKRKITAQYGKVVLTKYAFLHNSNMWFGNDITVTGPVFANGGIRQDGTNTSTVESSRQTYTCGLETGCTSAQGNPQPEEKPGVWGSGEIDELWNFPVTPIDFDSIKVDFSSMKTTAQNSGLYQGPSGAQGYHVVFNSAGTFNLYRVTGTSTVQGYTAEGGCENMQQTIVNETLLGTYNVSEKSIIFLEDNVWVEGVVNGQTTIAAARFPIGSYNTVVWIPNDLTYLAKNGNHKLGIVVENDIIFTKDIPEYFDLNGALLAQNGRTIRHHYGYFGCKSGGADKMKKELNFYGSLISNLPSYWNHSSGPKSPASGIIKTTLDYDPENLENPPPYFPAFGGYQFLGWKEEDAD